MAWFNFFSRKVEAEADEDAFAIEVQSVPQTATSAVRAIPRFHDSAREFATLGHSRLSSLRRARVRDAFTPSQPVLNPQLFAGRKDMMNTLIHSIEDLRLHIVLYGDRGMGKTSLLHILAHLAREAHYHVAYHSCGERAEFNETFRAIAARIPLIYHSGHDPTAEITERGGSLADLLPPGDLGINQIAEVLTHLSNTRVLVILDEFDRSPSGTFRRNIAELIKTLSDRSIRVQLLIAGVASNVADLVEHIPSIRRNIIGLRVGAMTGDEMREMIAIGEEIGGLRFEEKAIEQIVLYALGYPYLASLLSQYAGFAALDRESNVVTVDEVSIATGMAIAELGQRLSESGREGVERAIADGYGEELFELSGVSMGTMGRIEAASLASAMTEARFEEIAGVLAERYGLLESSAAAMGRRRYRFLEEAVPIYIWLMSVSRQLPS